MTRSPASRTTRTLLSVIALITLAWAMTNAWTTSEAKVPLSLSVDAQAAAECVQPAWSASEVYVGGDEVSHNDNQWRAKWWTLGEEPGTTGEWGVWEDLGSCDSGPGPTTTTTAPTTTTTTPGDDPPPDTSVAPHAVTGYWQNFDNGAATQTIADVPAGYDIVAVAFADSTATPGEITFNLALETGYGSEQEFKDDIAAKQAAGTAVVLSVGGQNGNVVVNDAASAQAFASSTLALMAEFGFDGVDIDLESGISATFLTQAMEAIHAQAGDSLVYTMAPQTLDMQSTGTEYFQLALNTQSFLTVVNMQYYNSGSMLGCDGNVYAQGSVDFITALACIQLEGGLAPSQVGLGLPASPSAAGSGFVDPGIVTDALDCLARGTNCGSFQPPQTYPDLRGAMTWSTNWDESNGFAWSNVVIPHVHNLP